MVNRTPLLVLAAFPLMALGCLAGCSAAPGPVEETRQAKQAVIKGVASDPSQDAVVLLVHYDRATYAFGECTGTLLAPNLVLTARHCVADTDQSAACDETGKPLAEGSIYKDHRAETMYVFTGTKRPDFNSANVKPAGQGLKIIHDGGKNLCNHDIAIVILKEPIAGAPIAPIRLEAEPAKGDVLTSVGWGVTDKSMQPAVRQQRANVKILAVGPSREDGVPPNEFEVGESICSGDSGGPALADGSGAIIGVVSRGGNGSQDQRNPAAQCIDGRNLYTKVAPFKDMIQNAADEAGAELWIEGGADPRLGKLGVDCNDGKECRSGVCGAGKCAQGCSSNDECSDGNVCNAGFCQAGTGGGTPKPAAPATTTTTGCSAAPSSSGASSAALALFGLAIASAARRRRR
jgi:MYXO-CTERM domain-containing protein